MATITSRNYPLVSLIPLNIQLAKAAEAVEMMHQDSAIVLHHGQHSLQRAPLLSSPKGDDRITPQSSPAGRLKSPSGRLSDVFVNPKVTISDDMLRSDRSSTADEISEARSSPVSVRTEATYRKEIDEDDRMSCCSDDSDLSVGKEVMENSDAVNSVCTGDRDERNREKNINKNESHSKLHGKSGASSTENNNFSSDGSRRRSTEMTDDISNESSSRYSSLVGQSPKENNMDSAISPRVPLIRPSPTRFQEEFLRNSHLYAEELIKHQMSFVAATRGLTLSPTAQELPPIAFALRQNNISPASRGIVEDAKAGFRPHIRTPNDTDKDAPQSPDVVSFRGIHSHLNAISQITNALNHDMQKLTSPGLSSRTSRESSQSPPTNSNIHHLHPHHPHHQQHPHLLQAHQNGMNNNLNEQTLKFSIDNILKADFGRRITEPLKRTKASKKSQQQQSQTQRPIPVPPAPSSVSSIDSLDKPGTPIDLTAVSSEKGANTGGGGSSSTSNSSSSSSGDGPMVWPAWVYCTRYSDRPSSGKFQTQYLVIKT